jgi:predicted Zn-dependent protease
VFNSKPERRFAEEKAEALQKTLNGYADAPNASYDILIRAMKINVMARNMDVGTDSAVKSLAYFDRLLKLKPQDPETQYWYGFSLAEGGGFQEGIPHMNVALKAGYQEAYFAIANAYMYMDKKPMAISTLNAYKAKYPTDAANADLLISQIKSGQRFSVWQNIPQVAPATPAVAPATTTTNAAISMPAVPRSN